MMIIIIIITIIIINGFEINDEACLYLLFISNKKLISYKGNKKEQGPRNSIISGEASQVKERTRAGNFKKLL